MIWLRCFIHWSSQCTIQHGGISDHGLEFIVVELDFTFPPLNHFETHPLTVHPLSVFHVCPDREKVLQHLVD